MKHEASVPVICHSCASAIYLGRYQEHGSYDPSYDPADDPVTWRHLNGYASCDMSGRHFAELVTT